MDKASWKYLKDETWHWKPHFVCDDLSLDLESELALRNESGAPSIFTKEDRKEPVFYDMPGMCLQQRALRTVNIEGLELTMPSQDWETLLSDIRLSPKRTFKSGLDYYKLHARFFCMVFTPEQRQLLIDRMELQLADARVEGVIDDNRFAAGIRGVNENAGREVVVSARAQAIDAAAAGKKGAN